MTPAIKILIIDDHSFFRLTVKQIISADPDFQVIGEADNGLNALEMIKTLKPDLVLLDIKMKGMSGLETLARIKSEKSNVCCVILTASEAENDILEALKDGTSGYLLKEMISNGFCDNLKKVMSGITILQENLKKTLINAVVSRRLPTPKVETSLSDRELEVLDHLTQQHKNNTIAYNMGISVSTVKMHIKHLLIKLNLSSRQEVATWAHKNVS